MATVQWPVRFGSRDRDDDESRPGSAGELLLCLALVAQDGLENFTIPWDDIGAIFIGGSTKWKLSIHVRHIIKAAQALGMWVHIGRVNDPSRFRYFKELGADSVDGSGISQYSWMRERLAMEPEPGLFGIVTGG